MILFSLAIILALILSHLLFVGYGIFFILLLIFGLFFVKVIISIFLLFLISLFLITFLIIKYIVSRTKKMAILESESKKNIKIK
jgi:hypothetical protein